MLSATVAKADLSEATNAQRGSAARARSAPFQFLDNDRWTQTATDGAGLGQGNATTITWGIVPDSTEIPAEGNFESESEAPSNLIAFMDGIYNSAADPLQDKAWFSLFEQVFDSWSTVSGITFVHEPNDDGAAFAKTNAPSGVLGTRPDIRIGGHAIDQDANTLAYAFFPNHGDMVIDTSDQFYADTSNNSLGFRNLVAHELGHALGIDHVDPIDGTKLMEAFVSPTIDGPQHDDILAVNRGYGDRLEKSGGNDTPRTAFDLGALDLETVSVDSVSIDDNSDLDYYGFTVGTGHAVTVTLSPVGSIYRSGAENGTVAAFNSQAQSDLTLAIIGTNGVTALATANSNGAGSSEVLANVVLAGAGQFYVKVTGSANAAQQYTLNLTITDAVADASIGGLVWNDTDGGGALGEAEVGIDGVTVALHLDDGDGVFEETTEDPLVASMDTADGGAFDFADLASGPYWVNVLDSPAVLEGFAQTSGVGPLLVNLDVSEDFNDADFGYQQQDATIGNLVWNDANGDGVYDKSEMGISDVNVLLYLDDGDGQFEGGGEDTLRSGTVTSSAPTPTSTATDSPVSSIGSGPRFRTPFGMAVTDDGVLMVVDNGLEAVVQVDLATGDRTVISDADTGSGPAFSNPYRAAVTDDGMLAVVDISLEALIRVDPATGNRTIISGPATGTGPDLSTPWGVAAMADGMLAVVDAGIGAVVRVDPATGDRTVISDDDTGSGPGFVNPFDMAWVAADGMLMVLDNGRKAVVQVDPATGNRTVVSDADTGSGPVLAHPFGIAVAADGMLMVVDVAHDAVVRVDLATGNRTLVSDADTGSGLVSFSNPYSVAVEPDGMLLVAENGLEAVVRVDPATGNRTVVSDDDTASSPAFVSNYGIAVAADGMLVVVDDGLKAVVQVDPATGNRTVISDADTGSGPLSNPFRLAVAADGMPLVIDKGLDAVVRVDPATGDRTIVSGADTGSGPALSDPYGIAIAADGMLGVVDVGLEAVVRVDPVTGDRTIVSDADTGSGPALSNPFAVAVADDGMLVVVDNGLEAVVQVDPVTGDRTVLSDDHTGSGPGFVNPFDVAVTDDGMLMVADKGLEAVVQVDPATGNRTVISDANIGSNSGIAVNDDGYDFINLPAGHYWVAVDDSSAALTGFGMTGGTTPLLVDLAPGEDFDDADFGYQQQDATIGNLLWDDSDGNGHHDHDEVGIDGVTITLYSDDGDSIFEGGSEDTLVASTVTADGGDYDFTDLSLGTYWVDVDENSDLLSGFALSGGSDPHSVNLAAGEDFNDADFGYFKLVTLSGTKFDDVDGDGVKDAGDPGLAEWEIELDIDSNGTIDQTVLTEADGTYRFANIGPGTHTLSEVLQAEFVQTAPTGGVQTVTPQSGQDVADLDFGNFALAQIRGTKFADENANGGRDADEGGLAGWTMFLDDNANGVLDESETAVVTDANGDYVFPGLPPGTYTVAAELREGFVRTLPQFADELSGQNEIPPIATDGSGQVHAVFDVTTNTLQLDIRFAGLADDITAIHMHRGGPGEAGPFIYDLDERFGLAGNFASPVIGAVVIGQEDLVDLRNGNLYVNLHTSAEPAGELRAQIQHVTAYTISPSSGEVIEDRDFGNAPLTEISFGDGIARKVVVTENDGTLGTVSLRRGSGSLSLLGGNIQQDGKRKLNITGQNVRVHSVTIDQSESETVLRLRARGGDRRLHVTDITVEGPIGNIRGKRAVVHGNVHVMGTANRATFDQFIGPSQLTIGQWDGRQIVKLSVNDAFDLSVTSRAPLSLTAGQVLNTDGVTDTIEVPFVHKLRVVKNFAADLVLTATATKRSINKAVIGGWLENANITAPNDIRTMILGGIRNATVHSGVRQGFTTDDGDSLPDSADDFTPNQAEIHRFVVRGIKDEPFSVINSTVAAWTLKRVKIHRVKTDEIASHGFAAHRIGSYMRLREESFSPRSTKMTGPVIFDALDRYAVELVASGRV